MTVQNDSAVLVLRAAGAAAGEGERAGLGLAHAWPPAEMSSLHHPVYILSYPQRHAKMISPPMATRARARLCAHDRLLRELLRFWARPAEQSVPGGSFLWRRRRGLRRPAAAECEFHRVSHGLPPIFSGRVAPNTPNAAH